MEGVWMKGRKMWLAHWLEDRRLRRLLASLDNDENSLVLDIVKGKMIASCGAGVRNRI
jgi:hypothetical protein